MVELEEKLKTCFVIAPIGSPDSNTRKKSDQVFRHIIKKAVEPLNYVVTRADQIHESGIITSQIVRQIVDASLVIADLSERNPNVFYELAVRHMTRGPLIMLITAEEQIPFDVSASRVIRYDLGDLDTVDAAREEIVKHISSIPKSSYSDNPITNAIDVKSLRESGNPEQRSIADIMEAINEIRGQLRLIQNTNEADERRTHKATVDQDYEALKDRRTSLLRTREFLQSNLSRLKKERVLPKTMAQCQIEITTVEKELVRVDNEIRARGHFHSDPSP